MPVVSTRPVGVHEGPENSLTNQATSTQTENNAAVRAAPEGAQEARAQLPGLSAAQAAPNSTLTGRAASTEEPARTAHLPDIAAAQSERAQLPGLSEAQAAPERARTEAARIPGIARRVRRQNSRPLTTLTPIVPGPLFDGEL